MGIGILREKSHAPPLLGDLDEGRAPQRSMGYADKLTGSVVKQVLQGVAIPDQDWLFRIRSKSS